MKAFTWNNLEVSTFLKTVLGQIFLLALFVLCVVSSVGVLVNVAYLPLSAVSIGLLYFLLKKRGGSDWDKDY